MSQWFMITLVGKDQIGIVAKITTSLYKNDCNLGEASMLRLGGNFTVMLMVSYNGKTRDLNDFLQPIANELQLQLHIDMIDGQLHHHQQPNLRIIVHGTDRIGIVAQVTTVLAQAGFNILDLESDVGGVDDKPFYVMNIEGVATTSTELVETALQELLSNDLKIKLEPIEAVMM